MLTGVTVLGILLVDIVVILVTLFISFIILVIFIIFVMLLVERRPCLVLVMWPFAVAVEGGRCFVIRSLVMPGKVMSSRGCFVRTRRMADAGADPRDW